MGPATVSPTVESVSIAQAAEREGVHPDTIRRRIADGTLPAYRVGPKLIRIRVADLDACLRRIPTTGGAA